MPVNPRDLSLKSGDVQLFNMDIQFPNGVLIPVLGRGMKLKAAALNSARLNAVYNLTQSGSHILSSRLQKPVDKNTQLGLIYGTATEDEKTLFINANWIMRPPLTSQEIALMPIDEVVALYYGLLVVKDCFEWPNPVVSAGLPVDYGIANERLLRDRIYRIRQDLWQVTNPTDGKIYRVLIPPNAFPVPDPAACKSGLGPTVVLGVLGLVGGWVGIIAAATSAAITTDKALNTKKLIESNSKVGQEVGVGIELAKIHLRNPPVDKGATDNLRAMFASWQTMVKSITPRAKEINNLWTKLKVPEAMLAANIMGSVPGGQDYYMTAEGSAKTYIENWRPYSKFFYSDTVAKMVLGQSVGGISSEDTPDLAGVGIGALLLLLL